MPSSSPGARAAVVLNGGLVVAFVALWVNLMVQGSYWRADFTAFYLGGRMVLAGEGSRLYDLEAQGGWQAYLWPERGGAEALLAYVNPPHAALLLAPLALLPRAVAFGVWTLVNAGLLVLLLRFVRRYTADWPADTRAAAVATVLAFPPLFITFQLGQVSLLGVVCLLGFYEALRRSRPWATAGWLVLATVKPQLALVPAVTLLAGRRWRELALAAGLFGVWALAATAVLGASCWTGFLNMLGHCSRQFGTYGIDPLAMYNLKGLLTALLGAEQAGLINMLTALASGASLLAVLWLWRGPWPGDTPRFGRLAALTLLWGLIANPHVNPADALALVVPALLLSRDLQGGQIRGVLAVGAAAGPLLFLLDVYVVGSWRGQVRPFFFVELAWAIWLTWQVGRKTTRSRQ
jgi:hypothetical protein